VLILVFILYMLFASTFTLAKAAMLYMAPFFFIGVRMLIAGSLLLGYLYFTRYFTQKISGQDKPGLLSEIRLYVTQDWKLLLQLGFFHIFCAYTLEFWALQYVSSGKAALIFSASPFITALLLHMLYRDRLSRKQWAGLSIGFLGLLPVIIPHIAQESLVGSIGLFSYPELALIGSVISSCYGWLVFKELMVHRGYEPLTLNGIGMSIGGVGAVIVSAIVERGYCLSADFAQATLGASHSLDTGLLDGATGGVICGTSALYYSFLYYGFIYMAGLIVIANIICYNLYGYLLKRYSATFLSFAGLTTPLFALIFGFIFLGEPLSPHVIYALFIIVLGLYIFYQDELRKQIS
jgi:drug/metabolite transporter (DMT)-like permease